MCGKDCNCGCSCGCECRQHNWRRFSTQNERVEKLQRYKEELEKELEAVKERLDGLQ